MFVKLTGRATSIETERIDEPMYGDEIVRFRFLLERQIVNARVGWYPIMFDVLASAGCALQEGDRLIVSGNYPGVFRLMNALSAGEAPEDSTGLIYAETIESHTRNATWTATKLATMGGI
jgi:hypothetical protein